MKLVREFRLVEVSREGERERERESARERERARSWFSCTRDPS